jgi:hypothetical protein
LQLFIICVIVASVEADGGASGIPPETDGIHGIDDHPQRPIDGQRRRVSTMDFDPGKTVKDAAYITVGVGVTAFQQGQVRRREVQKKVTEQAKETSSYLATRAQDGRVKLEALANDVRTKASAARGDVAGRVEPLVGDLGQRVQPIVEQLQLVPAQVKQAAEAGVTRAKELVNRAA